MKRNVKKAIIIAIVVVLVIVLIVSISAQSKSAAEAKYDMFTMETGTISKTVISSASVVTDNVITVVSPLDGTLKWKVEDGAYVEDGTIVAYVGAYAIRATFDGEVVFSVPDNTKIKSGTELLKILDFDGMKMRGTVSELDIVSIHIGQEVEISLSSSFDSYTGIVTYIDKQGVNAGGSTYYYVETTIEGDTTDKIFLGMNGDIKVETDSVENVVIAQLDKISFSGSNASVLVKNESGDFVQTAIEVGFTDGINVEVIGLPSGTEYYYETVVSSMYSAYMV